MSAMDYLFVLRADVSRFAHLDSTQLQASLAAFTTYTRGLARRGVMRDAMQLKDPSTATTVSHVGGRRALHDGSGEVGPRQLTGLYVVTAASLDEALSLAEECPILSHGGSVEVRPLQPRSGPRARRPSRRSPR